MPRPLMGAQTIADEPIPGRFGGARRHVRGDLRRRPESICDLLSTTLVVWAVLLSGCSGPAVPPGPAERPSGDPRADFARAVALQREGQHSRSVPYFRAAAAADPRVAQLHVELGKALHNASIQMDFSGRAVRFVVARSQDRARLRHEALAALERGAALAAGPDERWPAWFAHARVLEMSGDVAGALVSVERGLESAPGERPLQRAHARLADRLRTGR